jgi:hypothetical protein
VTIKVIISTYCPEQFDGPQWEYPRSRYLLKVVDRLSTMLRCDGLSGFVLANDGPVDQWHIRQVTDRIKCEVAGGPRVGLGGSLNRAMGLVGPDDLWMYTTDDWLLTERYDLTKAVKLIREYGYDYVRLGPPHPDIPCTTRFSQDVGWWLRLERCRYAFATRPFLADRSLYEDIGGFKEHCDAYEVEVDYSDRVARYEDSQLRLAEVVHGSLEGPWEHIGQHEAGRTFP